MKIVLSSEELVIALLKYYPHIEGHSLTGVEIKGGTSYEPLEIILSMIPTSNNLIKGEKK